MKLVLFSLILLGLYSCGTKNCSFVCYSKEIKEGTNKPYEFISEKRFYREDKVDFCMNTADCSDVIKTIDSCYLLRK